PRTIRAVKRRLELGEKHPTLMLTHSMGGQMAAVFLARPEAKELNVLGYMGVGTGTPYYRGFTGRTRFELKLGSLLMSAIVLARGYQPEGLLDIANYGRQARNHILEWTKLAQRNSFKNLHGNDMDYVAGMKDTDTNILLMPLSQDDVWPLASGKIFQLLCLKGRVGEVESPADFAQSCRGRWPRQPIVEFRCLGSCAHT